MGKHLYGLVRTRTAGPTNLNYPTQANILSLRNHVEFVDRDLAL